MISPYYCMLLYHLSWRSVWSQKTHLAMVTSNHTLKVGGEKKGSPRKSMQPERRKINLFLQLCFAIFGVQVFKEIHISVTFKPWTSFPAQSCRKYNICGLCTVWFQQRLKMLSTNVSVSLIVFTGTYSAQPAACCVPQVAQAHLKITNWTKTCSDTCMKLQCQRCSNLKPCFVQQVYNQN